MICSLRLLGCTAMAPHKVANGASNFLFDKEESVLAFHGPLLHEATIEETVEREAPDSKIRVRLYLVHYDGWNKHWDEWLPESRVLKATDANRNRQRERLKEFQRAHKRKRQDAAAAVGSKAKAAKPAGGAASADESLCAEIRENLRLPHGAKLKLIEDWEHITRERKLVNLPREPTINMLLEEFVTTKARRTSHERIYGEVVEGVRAYFNQALPTILLYKYERRQYRELKEAHKSTHPCDYYGAEHLLRLFVKFPELLARCQMQREHMTVLVSKLGELLKFMVQQKAKYLSGEYLEPDGEYLKWWKENSDL